MPRRSAVQGLPDEVKAWLDQALIENAFGAYEALAAELKSRGYQISKSALHRYGEKFEERLQAVKMATDQARAIVQASPDDEGAVTDALMRLVQEKLFQVLLDFQIDPKKPLNLSSAAKAIAELGRASVTHKKYMAEVREKALAAADAAAKIGRRGGLSKTAVDEIRREILGIAAA